MLFIGDDWAEAHHDIEIVDESGRRLARRRLPEGVDGLAGLHALVADHLAGAAHGVGHLTPSEHLGTAGLRHRHRTHAPTLMGLHPVGSGPGSGVRAAGG